MEYVSDELNSESPVVWLIAPGRQAEYWDVCKEKGIICVGWVEATRELKEKLLEIQDRETFEKEMRRFGYRPQSFNQLWDFLKEISIGDIVLAKKGADKIIGVGIVKSEPKIDLDLGDYPIYREVEWCKTDVNIDSPISLRRTLTRVTEEDIEQVPELKKIIEEVLNKDWNNKNELENFSILEHLLKDRKQVILYGPPGTGKTWLAKKFVDKGAKTYKIAKRSLQDNVKFFWWTINPDKWDYTQLEEDKSIEMWYGQLKRAFEEINDGDIVFIYVGGRVGKIYAVGIYEEKEGKPYVKVQKRINGPGWEDLREDKILRNSLPVRIGARGTLFPLTTDEGSRLVELSNLNLSELGLKVEEIQEEVRSVEFVTFHPSYSYEEFVEGLRPVTDEEEGNIKYEVKDGIFKIICKNAYNALMYHAGLDKRWEKDLPELDETEISNVRSSMESAPKFFLIIDEINRGDISKIFGELITLLEADKRLFAENEIVTTLPYSKERFGVPPNLYIIGTMNTADRSIALIDVALRRRFGFIEVMPSYRVLINELGAGKVEREEDAINEITMWSENEIGEDVKKLAIKSLYILNQKIQLIYDRDHQIGHSYLLKLKDGSIETLKQIWYHEIIPLLQEYFYNDWQKLRYLLGEFVEEKQLRDFADFELVDDEDARIYTIKHLDGENFINAMVSITKAKSQSAE